MAMIYHEKEYEKSHVIQETLRAHNKEIHDIKADIEKLQRENKMLWRWIGILNKEGELAHALNVQDHK